jgi:Zn-dependent M28 family amino/carboxypeptidase
MNGDSINNGADDDASGVVTVLEVARMLASSPQRPRRTIVFLLTTGEERGLLGTRWYIEHPVRPLERTVANLEIEMIGRPDSLAGGAGKAWLTGYDRSTMGRMLRDNGIPLVADPRPAEQFFERSDNIAFARRGIPAHTISSFNMHSDYHRVTDEARLVDGTHMAAVINATARAARLLADGPAPQWVPGGQPAPPQARP